MIGSPSRFLPLRFIARIAEFTTQTASAERIHLDVSAICLEDIIRIMRLTHPEILKVAPARIRETLTVCYPKSASESIREALTIPVFFKQWVWDTRAKALTPETCRMMQEVIEPPSPDLTEGDVDLLVTRVLTDIPFKHRVRGITHARELFIIWEALKAGKSVLDSLNPEDLLEGQQILYDLFFKIYYPSLDTI